MLADAETETQYRSKKQLHKIKSRYITEKLKYRLNVPWPKFQKAIRIGLRLGSSGRKIEGVSESADAKGYGSSYKTCVLFMTLQAAHHKVYGEHSNDLKLFACRLGIELKRPDQVYYCAKNLIQITQWNSRQAWGIFNIVGGMMSDSRGHKYLVHMDKTTTERQNNFYKSLFLALSSLESGAYKFSLAELSLHFVAQQNNAMYNFLIGILYLHLGTQRFSKQKGTLFSLSVFFLKRYHALRQNDQESYYNLGRAFHQIDLLPQAIFYYNKCLEASPVQIFQHDKMRQRQSVTCYSTARFAAHNLSRIYLNSGAKVPAVKLLRQYPLT